MSIKSEILEAFDKHEVDSVYVNKDDVIHGEPATKVVAILANGKIVEGTFTNESKAGFGGVVFSSQKDIPGLMVSKIHSVLDDTSD